ncbi:MAG: PHP domain-containing protein [Gammaproteobacteria bacterium]|nr:PHP domain-containing protein [Gammaproteobacteria bacterium]
MTSYDLHSHTTASDGTLTPAKLVERAKAAGVDVLAITDHDTTEGLLQADQAGKTHGVSVVNGCEVSVTWAGITVHILGLNVDPKNEPLQAGLSRLREYRDTRAREIASKLEKAGVQGAFAGAKKHAKGSLISRTHFAHFLVESGYAKDVRSVFKHFLVKGKPGFVAGKWAELGEVVDWITTAGGQAAIAHPARYRLTRTKLIRLIEAFKQAGGEGFEVVSGSHSRDECFTMAKHACDFELLATAGSDFHGPENPWIELGRLPQLPPGCEPIWNSWH